MSNDQTNIAAEYRLAKDLLKKTESNRARAELRGDHAIVRAYDKEIGEQRQMLERLERRLYKALANDNML
jgi:hypothetical protein